MRPHPHVPQSAILMVAGSVFCFAILDAAVKYLTQRHPAPTLVWARYTVQTAAMMIWLLPKMGAGLLRTSHFGLHLVRAMLLPCSSLCFFSALKYLPLAEATAINYATPVLVVVRAVWFLGERMTRARTALVLAGVAGMLLIVRPGSAMFQGAAFLSLCAALFYGLFTILTRKLATEDWRVLLFYPAITGTVIASLILPWFGFGPELPWTDVALIVGGGLLGTFAHFLYVRAFQRAPASALTSFTYVHLVWATIMGWLVFGTFPDVWTLAGMAVIASSGLLNAMHERRRARGALQDPMTVD